MQRSEQAAASRAKLLAIGRDLFGSVGYDETTVAEVLRRAGMARGALYHYFPEGKADLFRAVFDELNAELHARRDSSRSEPSFAARIQLGARVFLELCSRADFARVILVDAPRLIPGQVLPGSTFRVLYQEIADALISREINADLDGTTIAHLLYGAIRGAGDQVASAPDKTAAVSRCLDGIARITNSLIVNHAGPERGDARRS